MARDPTGTAVYDPENPLTRTWTGKTPRPSPRTGSTGVGIRKFGTQQLKYLDTGGVIEKDVGARTRLTFGGEATTPATPFSARYQQQRPATIRTQAQLETSPHAIPLFPDFGGIQFPDLFGNGNGNGKKEKCHLDDDKPFCGITQAIGGEVCECPDWITGETTDPTAGGRGCECEACKNGTGQCDASVPICDAWDLGCIATGGKVEETFNWIKIILVVIGIGVLLWLLRPLFGVAKNVTGITKSAVTRVNGMK
tara:strand:- start:671 stop:1429 length:759 start_codon:yes stop_codon:yes gene_type:complete